ncbi:hypothetical protein KUF54_03910 [Comamonas sp. Y33R10-2]|uniref:hypothetical protein n=1 Tax=Comamonas sp. Y33R10-2 TaxID=2853257 RepID=UPI001C5CB143|nr:hypothetical protein [Comamonas sp. Y33R10-2]QXZ11478.1 hypothetical protein KUF54_03910 [Comamonas sp. Y33R10-2]
MRKTFMPLLLCSLTLASELAQAQQARCVDANGMGYACKGQEAVNQGQAMYSGQPQQGNRVQFNFSSANKNEGRDMFDRPPSSGISHDSMQQRLEQMDAAANSARASKNAPPKP